MPNPIALSVVYRTLELEGVGLIPSLANILSEDSDGHGNRIHSYLITVYCFDIGYVGKQLATWKEYCAE